MDRDYENKTVRLSDIADVLSISTVSVSNALLGKKGVSEELRQRVFDTAIEMGYTRIPCYAFKKKQPAHTIGVVLSERYTDSGGQSFYMRIYQEIVRAAARADSAVVLEVLGARDEQRHAIPGLIGNESIDGLVILGEMKRPYARILKKKSGVPIVFTDHYEDIPYTDFVISDSYNGMCAVTRLLIKNGYKKIGFAGRQGAASSVTDKYLGFGKALCEAGLPLRDEWIISPRTDSSGHTDCFELPRELPEAFVCHSDAAARTLIELLGKAGLRVPEDIGVAGFGNFLTEDFNGITLTTYDVDIRAMAEVTVNALIGGIERADHDPLLRVVPGAVKLGNSHLQKEGR